jgi:hypothetical protein
VSRIRQNPGDSSIQTTLGYIGALDASERRPPAIYEPPYRLSDLARESTDTGSVLSEKWEGYGDAS